MKLTLRTLLAGILLISFGCLQAQTREFNFSNAANSEGFSIERNTRSDIQVRHSLKRMSLETVTDNGYTGEHIQISAGIVLPADAGKPDMPAQSRFIAIPNGATVRYTIKNSSKQTIKNVDLMAAAPLRLDSDNTPATYEKDQSIYNTDAFYPASPVTVSEVQNFRGVQVVALTIIPFQYNPVTKELIVYDDLDVDLSFEGGDGHFGNDRLRSRYFDPILENAIFNYNQLPTIDYEARAREFSTRDTGCEYLIVIPNNEDFRAPAEELAEYRIKQGILTEVKSLSEMSCTTTTELKNYLHNAYSTWDTPPVAVLLFGDHNTNFASGIPGETISHPAGGTCITDNQYADVTGDYLPEMCFARLIAANGTEATMMVSKQLEYEYTAPNMDAYTYQNPITALGWQTERWFQICSEVVGGYWRDHGKTPVRINAIYSGSPGSTWSSATNTSTVVNYFGPNGLSYIPATPAELGGWSGGTAAQVVTAVNNGTMLLQHRDHGYYQGWGEPSFSNSYVSQMTNVGKMTFVMTINCQTGTFNYGSDCLVEAFMRRTYNNHNAGAVGCIGPTMTSYSFVNDAYVWGMYDLFDPQFMPDYGPFADYSGNWMPAFGNVAGKYFLAQSAWPYNTNNKNITYQMFTAHCDAFLRLYTRVPQTMNVTHSTQISPSDTQMQVTAPAGSVIALTVGNNIIAVADGTGSSQNVTFSPQASNSVIHICVTKQDYLRWEDDVTVISEATLNVTQVNVNDANNNGQLDYGESATFDITIKNVGNLASGSTTATLTTTSSNYVTVTNPTTTFQGINPNQTLTLSDVFGISVSNSVPDNTHLVFNIHMVSGSHSWDYSFTETARAPSLKVNSQMAINDGSSKGNNNGRLDPGETANITLSYSNTGGSAANNVMATLSCPSEYITISNPTITTATVTPNQTVQVSYTISVANNTPRGENVVFTLNVVSGAYNSNGIFSHRIGLDLENFESGNLLSYEWINDPTHPWTVVSTNPYNGTYCLQSGNISNNQTSELSITINVENTDVITFYKKTSSEQNCDLLSFKIDNQTLESWSGTTVWREYSAEVSSGEHTFTWVYSKNASGTAGEDKVWIDYILLPVRHIDFICMAGNDMNICKDATAHLAGNASGYETILWTTAGDGTFSSTNILNPTYTPGVQDIANESATLTLTITDAYGNTLSDDMDVILHDNASIEMDGSAEICANDTYNTSATVTESGLTTWSTEGDGTFANPAMLNTIYTPGTQDIANGMVTLMLNATSPYGCDGAAAELALTIHELKASEVSIESCGNYTWNGMEYTESGDYVQNLQTIYGCDSIVTLHLTMVDAYNMEINFTSCDSYTWNGTEYTASGTYTQQYQSIHGCDSLVILNLAINHSNSSEFTQVACDSFEWNGTTYDVSGDYEQIFTNLSGCDSTVVMHLTIESVNDIPLIEGETDVDTYYTPTSTYSIHAYVIETTYGWTIEPTKAGTLTQTDNNVTITWDSSFAGNATLRLSLSNICGNGETSLGINVKNSTSVDEASMIMTLFPNPADNFINISINDITEGEVTINIFNILGEKVLSDKVHASESGLNYRLSTSGLSSGSYLLNIKSDKESGSRTFIIR